MRLSIGLCLEVRHMRTPWHQYSPKQKNPLLSIEDKGLSQTSISFYCSLLASNFHLRLNSPYDISFLQVS